MSTRLITCSIERPATPPRRLISSTASVEPRRISSASAVEVPHALSRVPSRNGLSEGNVTLTACPGALRVSSF